MKALEGVWKRAREEFQEIQQNAGPGAANPEALFCTAYLLGVGFGLALSTVRPDMVRQLEPIYEERGWLAEHRIGLERHGNEPSAN